MQSELERIEYRLPDGYVFEYMIDHSVGVTTNNIDSLICLYFEHTGNLPETIFIRSDLWSKYICYMQGNAQYTALGTFSGAHIVSMWTSVGQVPVRTIADAYIPLLIGTQRDYDDNNINWLFEEIVLADCERE